MRKKKTKAEPQFERLAVIDKEIEAAIKTRESFAHHAREETDKDYKQGLYLNVENANRVIADLVAEKKKLEEG